LRVETFRSSGAGGQHVNKTDSAVRITHLPTGTVVSCQNERSQHSNRRTAMTILRAKLYELERAKRDEEMAALRGDQQNIEWGSQIRSYVMQPYTMVKDHRTSVETGDVERVLNGDLEEFMQAHLQSSLGQEQD
jgi:peptide chain release factor 2